MVREDESLGGQLVDRGRELHPPRVAAAPGRRGQRRQRLAALLLWVAIRHEREAIVGVLQVPPPRSPPEGRVDVAPFLVAGCTNGRDGLECGQVPALRELGCDLVWVDDELYALTPAHPIAVCATRGYWGTDMAATPFVRATGCMRAVWIRYVIWRDGRFELIASDADFRGVFGPVDSPVEARAFLVALRGFQVLRDVRPDLDERALAEHPEPSFAREHGDGYRVRVFEIERCGCGRHPTTAVELDVSRAGGFQELSRTDVLESRHEICVD